MKNKISPSELNLRAILQSDDTNAEDWLHALKVAAGTPTPEELAAIRRRRREGGGCGVDENGNLQIHAPKS